MSSEPKLAPGGHAEARRAVSGAYARGTLGGALLITGEEGLGKRDFAHWIVQAGVCSEGPARGVSPDPCGECPACRKVATGQHPDAWITERGDESLGSRHEITVAQVREGIVPFLSLRPVEATHRSVIIVSADEMNEEAQNALLKTLEEPPGGSRLMLTSAREEVLLDTVRSRCQSLRLQPLSDAELQASAPDVSATLVRLARGRPGRLTDLQSLDLTAWFDSLDAVLSGRILGSAFGRQAEELLDADEDEGDPLSRRRCVLDVIRSRLRDHVLIASGAETSAALTDKLLDASELPPVEFLWAADQALLEAAEDLRRHLPGPVVWGGLGQALSPSGTAGRVPPG